MEHSLSPVIHNAGYAALGLDWVYLGFQVRAGGGAAAVQAARTLGLRGLSVTMPHKADVVVAADELSPAVGKLGSANTIVLEGGRARAHDTDGPGLIRALREELRFEPEGKRCLVVGTGGAARAIILGLAESGAGSVAVLGRSRQRAEEAALLAGERGQAVTEPEEADLVVSATPALDAGGPLATARFGAGQLVVDVVYDPPETELLRRAAFGGARVTNGLAMLVHQAALQFKLFTGEDAPLAAMWAAVRGVAVPPTNLSR